MFVKSKNTKNKSRILPLSLRLYMSRRVYQLRGFLLAALGGFCIVSFISGHPSDPSLNNYVTSANPQNLLGVWGAIVYDLQNQLIGSWALLTGVPFVIWGWEIMNFHEVRLVFLRLVNLIVSLALLAMGSGALVGASSVFAQLGDFAAVWFVRETQLDYGYLLVSFAYFLIGFTLYAYALGLRDEQWALLNKSVGDTLTGLGSHMKNGFITAIGGITSRVRAGAASVSDHTSAPSIVSASARASEHQGHEDSFADSRDVPDAIDHNAVRVSARPTAIKMPGQMSGRETPSAPSSPRQSRPLRTEQAQREGDVALPSVDLISDHKTSSADIRMSKDELSESAQQLSAVLDDFGVRGDIVSVRPGPVVTLYELVPAPGIKSSRVIGLADDIARSMSAVSARVSVVPGRNAIGIELPNEKRNTVYLKELLQDSVYHGHQAKLPLILGKDIGGSPIIADLARMPHLLVAGTTGSGKSVSVNAMILSLLYRMTPDQCKFIMIDPKMLELSVYNGIPHLLTPVVTDPRKAVVALKWVVREMEDRYRAMSQLSVRNIDGYNDKISTANDKGEVLTRQVQVGFDNESGRPQFEEQELDMKELPFIVVIVDEMADLMLVAGKDVEGAIQRLAQMARAAGIHLIMATQRPSVDVITGTIKANFPTRISFQVTSKIDSRTILGEGGAEQLLGQGDMLYMAGGGRTIRVHGPFVKDHDVENVANDLRAAGTPNYVSTVLEENDDSSSGLGIDARSSEGGDELFEQAVMLIQEQRKASTSFIQRHLKIGYNRAATIMDELEKRGFVSEANHVGRREVLLPETGT